ncbi:MAG: hypothetical protein KAH18_12565 [Psychromonas sp.]|nr:hypothetical protein [Psychromonas sp.]
MNNRFKTVLLASFLSIGLVQAANAAEVTNIKDDMPTSLITTSPRDGRQLAMEIVKYTLDMLKSSPLADGNDGGKYQDDPQSLLYEESLVEKEFKTIAIANNYWRPS